MTEKKTTKKSTVTKKPAAQKPLYILMEAGFEYNDEVYSPVDGGNPKKVFTSKAAAQKVADEKNMSEFRSIINSGSIRDYGYSLDEVLDYKNATEFEQNDPKGIFMKLFCKPASAWWKSYDNAGFVRQPSDKDLKHLMDCFSFTFYHVVEVEKG